jgi:tRNA A-37 threonylcarbamoyl transferase component Bud32
MKKFRAGKSSSRLEHEANLLELAGKAGIAPRLIDYSRSGEWIVMDKMDKNLFDILKSTNGVISKTAQQDMIELFKKLDKIGIFHADPNPLNFMYSDGRMYLIDYGFAKTFDEPSVQALGTKTPNMDYMPLGFLVKIKDKCDVRNFPVLLSAIKPSGLRQIGL